MEAVLPDGTRKTLDEGATGADLAASIGAGLARAALAVKVDGEVRDLGRELPDGATVEIVTDRSPEALDLVRHDTAHVLATAALELFPGVKISIGPAIENGFYYDFEFPEGVTLSDADFAALEAKMAEHVAADEPFERSVVTPQEAIELFRGADQPYKVELIEDLVAADPELATVSLYRNGPFLDLCRGPHAPSTKRIKAFKLTSVAGAYWRGDSDRTMLTRVYGTAWLKQADLDAHLERLEQARARDHRRLGPELGLFRFSDVAPGMAFWLPKGTEVFNALVGRSREMSLARGYDEVKTPLIYDAKLWETSGHWGKYRENMFLTDYEERSMAVKPMNCPGHAQLFGMQRWSYRDLPVRYAEPGLLHRLEPSGTLHGLLRVRHFIQDDAHIFCTPEQVEAEVLACLQFGFDWYRQFGFEMRVALSTRPENRIGSDAFWDDAEGLLRRALEDAGYAYGVNEGDGAFYAPKIDIEATDSLGRSWQLGTVQLDYNMPQRFGLTYTGADNAEHTPVMIHRALLGSFERFIGILIEETAGELPFWLTPVQATVLPVADRHTAYAEEVRGVLRGAGLRVDVDDRTESIGRKIRDTELQKVPWMLVVGDREAEAREVAVRRHGDGDQGAIALAEAADHLRAAAG